MNDRLKDYVPVNVRLMQFYGDHPDGSIQTEILHHDMERIVMQARAYRTPDDPRPSIGHAEEIRGSSPVNRTNPVENCETSAIGRALAAAGYEIKNSIASREEIETAQARASQQATRGATLPQDRRNATASTNTLVADIKATIGKLTGEFGMSVDEAKGLVKSLTGKEKSADLDAADLQTIGKWLTDNTPPDPLLADPAGVLDAVTGLFPNAEEVKG